MQNKLPRPLLISSQSDYLIRVFNKYSHISWQTVQIQISWLLHLHCLLRQGMSCLTREGLKFQTRNRCSVFAQVSLRTLLAGDLLERKRNAGYIVYATENKYTRYWCASQGCTTQKGVLSKGVYFFLIIVTENRMKLVNLFNKDERLYKNKKKNECNITFITLKLSVKVTRHFFFVLVYYAKIISESWQTPQPLPPPFHLYSQLCLYRHSIQRQSRYNNNLNVTKPSLKRWQLIRNYASI